MLWYQAYNGQIIDVEHFVPSYLDDSTIVNGLFNICRFGGHVNKFYSVGEHSLLCYYFAVDDGVMGRESLLPILLHDVNEVYSTFGDVATPGKNLLRSKGIGDLDKIEERIDRCIELRYSINLLENKEIIKKYDKIALESEVKVLINNPHPQWGPLNKARDIPFHKLVKSNFVAIFEELLDV